jgi:5'-phosphate synthase pdxT subunit
MKTIGVLALQGGFQRHLEMIQRIGHDPIEVRYVDQLPNLDGLIIPGGESTTIGKLLERNLFLSPLQDLISAGFPVFGTCAGLILLANNILYSSQVKIGGFDIQVHRNAYGSQIDSFETPLEFTPLPSFKTSLPTSNSPVIIEGVFIRAPIIEWCSPEVNVLSTFNQKPVCIQQDNLLGATFHPELTSSPTLHEYFVSMT